MMKKVVFFISLVLIAGVCFAGCDHTDLEGEVIVTDSTIEVGENIPLKLKVPDELSGIYRTMWTVDPKENGEIIEGAEVLETLSKEELNKYFGENSELNPDRIAIFKAKEKGKCTIDVAGFYKQTNPQGIISIDITVE